MDSLDLCQRNCLARDRADSEQVPSVIFRVTVVPAAVGPRPRSILRDRIQIPVLRVVRQRVVNPRRNTAILHWAECLRALYAVNPVLQDGVIALLVSGLANTRDLGKIRFRRVKTLRDPGSHASIQAVVLSDNALVSFTLEQRIGVTGVRAQFYIFNDGSSESARRNTKPICSVILLVRLNND